MRPCTRRIASAEDSIKATSLDAVPDEHAPWCRTAPDALPIHIKPLMPRAADEPVRLTRIYTRGGDAELPVVGGVRHAEVGAEVEELVLHTLESRVAHGDLRPAEQRALAQG